MPYKQAFLKGREYLAKTAAISALCLAPIVAAWAQAPAYTLQVVRDGGSGHVSSVSTLGPALGGAQISCDSQFNQCNTRFHPDTNVVLTATPTEGFTFVGWGAATPDGPLREGCDYEIDGKCYLTMRNNTTVRANFAPVTILGGACQSRDFSDAEKTIIDAYIAYYGRPPDPLGLAGWAGQLERGDLHQNAVLSIFGDSDEFQNEYGRMDAWQRVNNLYVQIFGRTGDEAGVDFYTVMYESGGRSLATIAIDILQGAKNDDYTVLENRRKVARHFVVVSAGRHVNSDIKNIKRLFSLVNSERIKIPRTAIDPATNAVVPVKDSAGNDIFDTTIDVSDINSKANSVCSTFTDLAY